MSLLDPPRCPNCNSEIDLKPLWDAALKSGDARTGRVAMKCPVCGMNLRVLLDRVQLTVILAIGVPLALLALSFFVVPMTRGSMEDKIRVAIYVVAFASAVFVLNRFTPRLLTVRLLRDGERARFPLAPPIPVDREAVPKEDDRPSWVCPKCGEESPGNFDECWKCLAMKPEAGTSSSS